MRKSLSLAMIMMAVALVVGHANQEGRFIGGIYFAEGQGGIKSNPLCSPGDTLYSFPTPSTWPGGLAWDGEFFWNQDIDSRSIYKLDSTGAIITSFPVPPGASGSGGLEWDGFYLWAVDEQDAKLYKIDPETGVPLRSFDLPDSEALDPNCWGLAWDGTHMWVSQYGGADRIYEIDTANGEVLYSFPAPSHLILGISWIDDYLYGLDCSKGPLYKMNPADSSVIDSLLWQVPYCLGLLWDGSYWWNVSSKIEYGGHERVYKVDPWMTGIVDNNTTYFAHTQWSLSEIQPNPFNTIVSINYGSPKITYIELTVYNIQGKLVQTLIRGETSAGIHTIYWKGEDDSGKKLPSGVYFLKFAAGDYRETRKIILLR